MDHAFMAFDLTLHLEEDALDRREARTVLCSIPACQLKASFPKELGVFCCPLAGIAPASKHGGKHVLLAYSTTALAARSPETLEPEGG